MCDRLAGKSLIQKWQYLNSGQQYGKPPAQKPPIRRNKVQLLITLIKVKTFASKGFVKDQIWPTCPYIDPYLYKHFKITNNMITYVEQMGIQANEHLYSKWVYLVILWSVNKFSIIFSGRCLSTGIL